MDNLLPENETVEVEGRRYLNPNLVIDETNTFIDKLRGTQGMNTQEIATQTEMLGTDIPSSQGGLIGANSYFTSRYQTPQANSAVANLRRVAQESALNQALANEQAIWKKRYDEAYRRYQGRQNDKTNQSQNPYANVEGEEPEYETTTPEGTIETSISGAANSYTVVDAAGNLHIVDIKTGEEEVLAPGQASVTKRPAEGIVSGGMLHTLPNGNTVLVKPGYDLINEGGKYYLVNQTTGARSEVGGY